MNEQDLIDAVCLYVSDREQVNTDDVRAELRFDEKTGITAQAELYGRGSAMRERRIEGRTGLSSGEAVQLSEQQVIDSAAVYLADFHRFEPGNLRIELQFQEAEGIQAIVEVI